MRIVGVVVALLLVTAGAALPAVPADRGPEAATGASPAHPPADLVLANRLIVTLRASPSGIPPAGRVEAAKIRARAMVRRGSVGPAEAREVPTGYVIMVGGEGLFALFAGDVDPLSGESLKDLAGRAVANLDRAIMESRQARTFAFLLSAGLRVAAATVLFALALYLLRRLFRRLQGSLTEIAGSRADRVAVAGFSLFSPAQIALAVGRMLRVTHVALGLFAAYAWLAYGLQQFPYTRPWGERLGGYLVATVERVALEVVGAIPGLFFVVVIFLAARGTARIIGAFLTAVESRTISPAGLHPDTVPATRRIVNVLLWIFAIAFAYPFLPGSSSTAFKGVSLMAGVMISVGSSALVGQVLSGFMLIYSRTFRIGDYVRVGNTEGLVEAIGFFTTKIRTNKREQVSIPNALVLGGEIKNYTLYAGEHGVIVHTSVTIGYGTPWRQVHEMLRLAASRTPGLRREPAPFVLQTALSDFYVEYTINACLEEPRTRIVVLSALHANIQDAFNEHGVQIMSPHYEADPPETVVVPRERWHAPPARPDAAVRGTP